MDYTAVPEGKRIAILRVTCQDGEEILYDEYYMTSITNRSRLRQQLSRNLSLKRHVPYIEVPCMLHGCTHFSRKTYTYSKNGGVDVSDVYVINTGTLTPNGVVRDPDVPGETPETEASQESTAATVTSTAEYQEENETVYAKENNETVQLDDVDEAVDISIQEKELEQMDVILKIIAVMIVVIGAISGAGICLLWQKRKKK